jgi:hypothetical protein
MPPTTRFSKEIEKAMKSLNSDRAWRLPLDLHVAKWNSVFETIHKDGAWMVGLADAGCIGMFGIGLAMEQRRYADARGLANLILEHPEAKTNPREVTLDFAFRMEIINAIYLGHIDEGVLKLKGATGPNSTFRDTPRRIGTNLGHFLDEQPEDDPISPALRELSTIVLSDHGTASPSLETIESIKTIGELRALLLKTWRDHLPIVSGAERVVTYILKSRPKRRK